MEWFGLDRMIMLKIMFQPPCHWQGDLPLELIAQSSILPGLILSEKKKQKTNTSLFEKSSSSPISHSCHNLGEKSLSSEALGQAEPHIPQWVPWQVMLTEFTHISFWEKTDLTLSHQGLGKEWWCLHLCPRFWKARRSFTGWLLRQTPCVSGVQKAAHDASQQQPAVLGTWSTVLLVMVEKHAIRLQNKDLHQGTTTPSPFQLFGLLYSDSKSCGLLEFIVQ